MEDLVQALLQGHSETQPCFGVCSVLEQRLPSWRSVPSLYIVSHEKEGGRLGVNLQAPGEVRDSPRYLGLPGACACAGILLLPDAGHSGGNV